MMKMKMVNDEDKDDDDDDDDYWQQYTYYYWQYWHHYCYDDDLEDGIIAPHNGHSNLWGGRQPVPPVHLQVEPGRIESTKPGSADQCDSWIDRSIDRQIKIKIKIEIMINIER